MNEKRIKSQAVVFSRFYFELVFLTGLNMTHALWHM